MARPISMKIQSLSRAACILSGKRAFSTLLPGATAVITASLMNGEGRVARLLLPYVVACKKGSSLWCRRTGVEGGISYFFARSGKRALIASGSVPSSSLNNPKNNSTSRLRVSLVGKPNVGKSSLANKLLKRDGVKAIVSAVPGTTRDRIEGDTIAGGMHLRIIDTGGLDGLVASGSTERRRRGELQSYIECQASQAVQNSDAVLFVLDGRTALQEEDRLVASWLRHRECSKRTIPVVNKLDGCDGEMVEGILADVEQLGFGEPIPLSVAHGEGMGLLLSRIAPIYDAYQRRKSITDDDVKQQDTLIHLAIIGRPNVGKSSLLNSVLDEDRALTGSTPGLTRDSVAVEWRSDDRRFRLVDTAGIRKTTSSTPPLEEEAIRASMLAIKRAQVVVLVLDSTEGVLRRTELSLASKVADEGKALVIAANKADLAGVSASTYARGVRLQVEQLLPNLGNPPIGAICALTGFGVENLMSEVASAHDRWRRRIPTGLLNSWLRWVERVHPPPSSESPKQRPTRLKYLTQVSCSPPIFCIFINTLSLAEDYQRFLIRSLRNEFGFHGVPVSLALSKAKNPFASRKSHKTLKKFDIQQPQTRQRGRRRKGRLVGGMEY